MSGDGRVNFCGAFFLCRDFLFRHTGLARGLFHRVAVRKVSVVRALAGWDVLPAPPGVANRLAFHARRAGMGGARRLASHAFLHVD